MSYSLGTKSRSKLKGVHPNLVKIVERAIEITTQDFAVHCSLRGLAEQRRHVAAGISWSMNSKHLKQTDGFSHAVDLVPVVGGALVWEWPRCYLVASAMSEAGRENDFCLRWGGVWDRQMEDFGSSSAAVKAACSDYVDRRRRLGKRAAIDGPHFELV